MRETKSDLFRLRFGEVERAAGKDNTAFALRKVAHGKKCFAAGVVAHCDARTGGDLFTHVRKRQLIRKRDRIIVGGILEREREDAGIDQVCLMDTRERYGKYRADAEVERNERRVLARGPLAVICAADDKTLAGLFCARG